MPSKQNNVVGQRLHDDVAHPSSTKLDHPKDPLFNKNCLKILLQTFTGEMEAHCLNDTLTAPLIDLETKHCKKSTCMDCSTTSTHIDVGSVPTDSETTKQLDPLNRCWYHNLPSCLFPPNFPSVSPSLHHLVTPLINCQRLQSIPTFWVTVICLTLLTTTTTIALANSLLDVIQGFPRCCRQLACLACSKGWKKDNSVLDTFSPSDMLMKRKLK